GNCPIMLPTPTLAERVILPAAWGGSYFFNRIGQKQPLISRRLDRSHTPGEICRKLEQSA
ncbi:hypothetical protein, partial [Pseudomonas aeruginosa]|uniref:hypothetical protein n=1 Tax=Pseudomonas aeruginosa TaxID=287 RepID=UPI001C1047C8